MNNLKTLVSKLPYPSIAVLCIMLVGNPFFNHIYAAPLGLSNAPLDVQEGVAPNITLTMDDSGSMAWSFLPDGIFWDYNDVRGAASARNAMYYNPEVTYTPGVDENGATLGNATFSAAWNNGYDQAGECTHNLTTSYGASWYYGDNCDGSTDSYEYHTAPPSGAAGAAYYYTFNATNTNCDGTDADNDCYDAVIVRAATTSYTGGTNRTDCAAAPTCTFAEESQNFANWFSYYRSRQLLAKTSAGRAFSLISGGVRVSRQALNSSTVIPDFVNFTGTNRTTFFNWLYAVPYSGGTPLRPAFTRTGDRYSESGINSPYAEDAGVTGTPEYSCRQNFHIAFTDGYWNGGGGGVGNYDNTARTLPANAFNITNYTAGRSPYADANSDFVADIVMRYWAEDLRTDLTNNVPTYLPEANVDYDGNGTVNDTDRFWNPANNPASWQHVVTFTVGLGVDGALAFNDTTYQNLINGTTAWSNDHVDDLWHAAINGRGQYFSAGNPTDLVNAFTGVLTNIQSRIGSSSAPAPSAPRYQVGTLLFQPVYDTSDWHGNLRAFDVTDLNTVLWNAQDRLNTQDYLSGRNIISYRPDTDTGIAFLYSQLSPSQQGYIASNVLDYIRGDNSNELKNGGTFRNRSFTLGDVVNSEPVYVGPPNRLFPTGFEAQPYSTFATTYLDRRPIIWFGANDGILHGFDATNGNTNSGLEVMAYVPSKVYPKLTNLTSPAYTHEFFVDGSPSEHDAFFSNAWHTVLVGGLNGGGQLIYALDITNPTAYTEANASNLVLWEFTDEDDADLGYTFSTPQAVKMNNGKWMTIFGNGYNSTVNDDANSYCTDNNPATPCPVSTTGDAVLFILDMAKGPKSGGAVYKLSTETGMAEDPTGNSTPNGLATVEPIDINRDLMIDYIYAGDLFGNLWKFDVRDSDPTNWTVYKSASNTPTPLFIATDELGNRQPITSKPVVGRHPEQSGYIVNFGTGKYLELTNLADTSLQTFYGVWDRDETTITTFDRDDTYSQIIELTNTLLFTDYNARVTSDGTFNFYKGNGLPSGSPATYLGWHMDLYQRPQDTDTGIDRVTPGFESTFIKEGERVVYVPQRRGNRIIFTTVIPSENPCSVGGESWLMEVNATTGARLELTPFDYNGDGIFSSDDLVQVDYDINGDGVIDSNDRAIGSGIQDKNAGKQSRTTILIDDNGDEYKITSDSNGNLSRIKESGADQAIGRRSWIQILPN